MKVGDRVVCVKPTDGLVYGDKYTIKEIHISNCGNNGLVIEEIRPVDPYYIGFLASRFRKTETYKAKENCINFNTVEEGLELTPELV